MEFNRAMTTENEIAVATTNPALIKLSTVENEVLVTDMNYGFHYHRVRKPDSVLSDYFALSYKENNQETWSVCRNLLSKVFTVAKTEQVIAQIQENLGGNIQNEQHYRSDASVRSSFTLSGFQISVDEEPDIDLVLFKLITNITADISVLSSSNLTFNIVNGFAGNHALQLAFGLLKTTRSNIGSEEKVLPMNNIFILDRFTKRLIHDGRMAISIEDVVNVQQQIASQITLFKRLQMTQTLADRICEKIPKKFAKKFIGLYENIPENLKNFYYISYVLGVLLDSERNITLEIKLRDIIKKMVADLESV